MSTTNGWSIEFYIADDGQSPVRDFLASLDAKTQVRSRNIAAMSRRRSVYRSRQRTTSRTRSVGYCRWLSGVPVRSLQTRRQWSHRNVR